MSPLSCLACADYVCCRRSLGDDILLTNWNATIILGERIYSLKVLAGGRILPGDDGP